MSKNTSWKENFAYKIVHKDGQEYKKYKSGKMVKHIVVENNFPECPCVYMVEDLITGLRYIGSTKNMKSRYRSYLCPNSRDYKKRLFTNMNPSNIEVTIIREFNSISREELLLIENDYIIKFNTIYPNGMNAKPAYFEKKEIEVKILNTLTKKNKKKKKASSKVGVWNYGRKSKNGFKQIMFS